VVLTFGDADAAGDALAGVFELLVPTGWLVQPTAKAERVIISPRAVFLNIFMLRYLVLEKITLAKVL
jgi:hypothetical protein